MARRVFIALKISGDLKQKILDRKKSLGKLPVRWIKEKNLHVTLVPPWYVDEISGVKKTFEELKGKFSSFKLLFNGIMFGPGPIEPKMIWLKGETPPQIIQIKNELEQIFHQEPPVKRNFKLHITLARFSPENFQSFPIKNLDEKVVWEENASAIVLMESHRSPQETEYEILSEIPL